MSTMARLRWLALLSVTAFVASNVLADRFVGDEPAVQRVDAPASNVADPR